MRISIRLYYPFLILFFLLFKINAFGQPSNYNWQREFTGWNDSTMTVNSPVNGIITSTQKATEVGDEFNLNWDNRKWQNGATPFNEEYIIYEGDHNSPNSLLQTNTVSGHYYTLQIEGLDYSNRNAVLMETTNAPQFFAGSNPVTPSNPEIAPGQALLLTINLAGNKSSEEKAFVRYTKDGFATSEVREINFTSSTADHGTVTIPGEFNTANANVKFYIYTTTVSATSGSNHDLISLKLANNSGSNYQYTVKAAWRSVGNGNWNDPEIWETNAIPVEQQEIRISSANTVTIPVTVDTIKIGPLIVESGASLIGNTGTTVAFPGGGYTTNYGGTFAPYNMVIGDSNSGSTRTLYVNDDIEIKNDLTIRESGKLVPGGGKTPTLSMSGTDASFKNLGDLDCNPDLGNTSGEKLKFYFPGTIILRSNGNMGAAHTRFSDIRIPSGGSLTSDAAGKLNAELQFGILNCDGVFNMGHTSPGVVDFTIRGWDNNSYQLHSSNPDQRFQFHTLIIGNSENTPTTLGLDTGSESVEIGISGNFEDYGLLDASNGNHSIKTIFNGAGTEQIIRGIKGQTRSNTIAFAGLEINNAGGSVIFKTSNGGNAPTDNVSISVATELSLVNGRLVTFDDVAGRRHELRLEPDASIDYLGAQSDPATPCYIEGPLSRAVISGNGQELNFPVGQGDEYRLLKIRTDADGAGVFTVENFRYSPADFSGMNLENPILNISDVRFWNVKTTNSTGTSNTQISVEYGNFQTDGVNSESDLRLVWAEEGAGTDGDPGNNIWKDLGPASGGSSGTITSNPFTFTALADRIDITLGNTAIGVNPLPVTWLYFEGSHGYAVNKLEWATGSESDNSYFEIERSTDARSYETIGKVQSYGDSNTKQVYYFTDRSIRTGIYYYRIKQVDRDGNFEYSSLISLSRHSTKSGIFPNPFREKVVIFTPGMTDRSIIKIWDNSGKLIMEREISGGRTTVDGSGLTPGFYLAKIITPGSDAKIFKLIKSR